MRQQRALPSDFVGLLMKIQRDCQRAGGDYIETLNGKGLLATPAREREIRVEALTTLSREIGRWQPHEMLRIKFHEGNPCTPADMFFVILEFIDRYIEHERTKEW